MKGAEELSLPMEISYPESQNWDIEPNPCQPTCLLVRKPTRFPPLAGQEQAVARRNGGERFEKGHLEIIWGNMRFPLTLFNMLIVSFWTLLGVLALSVAFLYLSRP
jgi:hypothetical protein